MDENEEEDSDEQAISDSWRHVVCSCHLGAHMGTANKPSSLIRRYEHGTAWGQVAISPDGRWILVGDELSGAVRVIDAGSGQAVRTLTGEGKGFTAWAFFPDGKRILTGGWDHTARIWDCDSGRLLRTLTGHCEPVFHLGVTADGMCALSVSGDNTARYWRLAVEP